MRDSKLYWTVLVDKIKGTRLLEDDLSMDYLSEAGESLFSFAVNPCLSFYCFYFCFKIYLRSFLNTVYYFSLKNGFLNTLSSIK